MLGYMRILDAHTTCSDNIYYVSIVYIVSYTIIICSILLHAIGIIRPEDVISMVESREISLSTAGRADQPAGSSTHALLVWIPLNIVQPP